jgi:hypothetical protein
MYELVQDQNLGTNSGPSATYTTCDDVYHDSEGHRRRNERLQDGTEPPRQ